MNIEKTFSDFVEQRGGEVLDRSLNRPHTSPYADYIFDDEKIVAELKTLKTNPFNNKDFQKSFIKKQKEWIQKGYITLQELQRIKKISELPDKCYNDIEKLYTRPIKNFIEKANEQIKSTKINQNLSDYKGLLFLVSDGNYFLEPKHIKLIIQKLLGNGLLYKSIHTVLYFTVNMTVDLPDDPTPSRLWMALYRPEFDNVSQEFLNSLFHEWVAYYENVVGKEMNKISHVDEDGIDRNNIVEDVRFIKT